METRNIAVLQLNLSLNMNDQTSINWKKYKKYNLRELSSLHSKTIKRKQESHYNVRFTRAKHATIHYWLSHVLIIEQTEQQK